MRVHDIMKREVRVIGPGTDLATAGRIMGEIGCGILPVVGDEETVVGVLTDRDICLWLTERDRKPSEGQARNAMSGDVYGCRADEEVHAALGTMAHYKVRRLPVLDADRHLVGLLSLDDVVLFSHPIAGEGFTGPLHVEIAETLHAICEHPLPVHAN